MPTQNTSGHAPAVSIRPLTTADLREVAGVQRAAFPESAVSQLGLEACRRFFEWLLVGPHDSVGLGAYAGGRLVGFCFGGVWRGVGPGFVRRNRAFLVLLVCLRPWLLGSSFFRERLRIGARFLRRPKPGPAGPPGSLQHTFGIQSIAVHPDSRRQGIARLLLVEIEKIAAERSHPLLSLNVHTDNTAAIQLYERAGWEKYQKGAIWMGHMVKKLP